jgi:putative peptidoglycan lipid II flippase
MSEDTQQANRQIARASGTVMFAFALSQVAGLVRQILFTRAFGPDPRDAFTAANTYPNIIFNLVAGGALASAFVPTFSGLLAKDDRRGAWRLASSITNLVMLILAGLSLLSAVLAPQIVGSILAPHSSTAQQALMVQLLRPLLITSTVFGVSGLLMGILNAYQRFLLPSLTSTMYWTGMVIGLIFFVPSMGILGVAWGAVLGSLLHLAIQLPDLLRLRDRRYTPTLGLGDPTVREVAILMGPRLFSVAAVQLSLLVSTRITTGLQSGSVFAPTSAFSIMTVPLIVIGSSIGTASLPTFSAQFARGAIDELRQSFTATLRGILLLSIPATVGLILLRTPLITFLFQRGEFDAQATQQVAWALLWYTLGLVFFTVVEIVTRVFFAMHNTMTPVIVGVIAMVLTIFFSYLFTAWFAHIGWMPLGGVALAATVGQAIETVTLFVLLRRKLNGVNGIELLKSVGAALLGCLPMAGLLLAWTWLFGHLTAALTKIGNALHLSGTTFQAGIITLGGVLLGGLVYGIALVLLRVPEVHTVVLAVRWRLSRK